ncbi:hypothetical protein SELMODRAFT_406665 [Selaginella moellendorffii]|uniref:Secreted protein n=1 Tax=Selaginella moellendorffii TaxID=88036 RepID=D8R128_SELML|nr:uncharacterized protein LOC9633624 [Selaginella moellendorffii]EFJ33831.1 hypothetical protein SELMODRAFT_406665 [Selaginella moellendorffii]|eukprot:XP_002964993.1 uncharacterized protein LOC9633624 [Selaginella moellendorffii]
MWKTTTIALLMVFAALQAETTTAVHPSLYHRKLLELQPGQPISPFRSVPSGPDDPLHYHRRRGHKECVASEASACSSSSTAPTVEKPFASAATATTTTATDAP